MRLRWPLVLLALAGVLWTRVAIGHAAATEIRSLNFGGVSRSFRLHIPPHLGSSAVPLVICLHGGGGTGVQAERGSGLSPLADREGFIVAYPDGIGHNWNDGREAATIAAQRGNVDDVGFIRALMDEVARLHPIDSRRIFVTGISNGGMMTERLAAELSDRIAAVAPIVGGIPVPIARSFKPSRPVSVMIFQGTADPLVPYEGGEVRAFGQKRGPIVSTEETVKLWIGADGCLSPGTVVTEPARDPQDGCQVACTTWSGGKGGTAVVLYRIDGGGHGWPGGAQYLPVRAIGRVCQHLDATALMWEFFKLHPKVGP